MDRTIHQAVSSGPSAQQVEIASELITSPIPDRQGMGLQMFYEFLSNEEFRSQRIPNEMFFNFMNCALYGSAPDGGWSPIQKIALGCLSLSVLSPFCDIQPLCEPRFIEFLMACLDIPDMDVINAALKILAIIFQVGEAQINEQELMGDAGEGATDAPSMRDILIGHYSLVDKLLSNPDVYIQCNIAEILTLVLEYAPNPMLADILMRILDTPHEANICLALQGVRHLLTNDLLSPEQLEGLRKYLIGFITSPSVKIVSEAYVLLDVMPVTGADEIQASITNMTRTDDAPAHAIHYLKRKMPVWAAAPPSNLLPTLVGAMQSTLDYTKASLAIELIPPALTSVDLEGLKAVVDVIIPFLSDELVTRHVLLILAKVWEQLRARSPEERFWFEEVVSNYNDELEDLSANASEEISTPAQILLDMA